jgi:hypothetical protein
MQYFNTLPKIIKYEKGSAILLTNLLARASIKPEFLNNAALYYNYDIQDGDTPEIIAYKYYGESYRYWVVLLINQIIDPQWQWPMDSSTFESYLQEKYPIPGQLTDVYAYQKIITNEDLNTDTITVKKINITQNDWNLLIPSTTTYSLPGGNVAVTISKNTIDYRTYEYEQNENNRTIKLLNKQYINEIENQLQSLMSV